MRIDIAGFTRGHDPADHQGLLRLCERLDRLGYHGIWFNEFYFQGAPYPSTLLLAAAVFARTERLRVGSSVLVLPLYHPLLLAEQIAQLHFQSGARLDIGIGRGTHPQALAALGIDPETTRARFAEAFALITGAWRGATRCGPGSCWPEGAPVGPLIAGPPPPLYLAGTTAETLGFAAANDLPLLLSLEPPETRQLSTYREVLGGARSRLPESSLSRYMAVARSEAEAAEMVDGLLPRLFERRLRAALARGADPDQIKPASRADFLANQMIAGTPESCARQLLELARRTGVGGIRLIFNGNGVLDDETALAGAALFAREGLAALGEASPRPSAANAPEAGR